MAFEKTHSEAEGLLSELVKMASYALTAPDHALLSASAMFFMLTLLSGRVSLGLSILASPLRLTAACRPDAQRSTSWTRWSVGRSFPFPPPFLYLDTSAPSCRVSVGLRCFLSRRFCPPSVTWRRLFALPTTSCAAPRQLARGMPGDAAVLHAFPGFRAVCVLESAFPTTLCMAPWQLARGVLGGAAALHALPSLRAVCVLEFDFGPTGRACFALRVLCDLIPLL
jgi:hypothetical protein